MTVASAAAAPSFATRTLHVLPLAIRARDDSAVLGYLQVLVYHDDTIKPRLRSLVETPSSPLYRDPNIRHKLDLIDRGYPPPPQKKPAAPDKRPKEQEPERE